MYILLTTVLLVVTRSLPPFIVFLEPFLYFVFYVLSHYYSTFPQGLPYTRCVQYINDTCVQYQTSYLFSRNDFIFLFDSINFLLSISPLLFWTTVVYWLAGVIWGEKNVRS